MKVLFWIGSFIAVCFFGFILLGLIGAATQPQLSPAERETKERTEHVAWLQRHPDRITLDESANIRQYGHYWNQTAQEESADAAWEPVKQLREDYPPVGGDYHPHNTAITDAYHTWERLELAAYGPNWRALWKERHRGDALGACPFVKSYGALEPTCVAMENAVGEIEPLEPMLFKCRSGGNVMPTDEVSCRTHGQRSSYSKPEVSAPESGNTNE